jgi:hypothetical protein
MRNVLIFPDGTQHQFMYPMDRELEINMKLQAQMKDNSIHVFKVKEIQKKEKEVYYFLELS